MVDKVESVKEEMVNKAERKRWRMKTGRRRQMQRQDDKAQCSRVKLGGVIRHGRLYDNSHVDSQAVSWH